MNNHTLQVLEFNELNTLIQKYACSDSGRQRLAKIRPMSSPKRAFQMTPLFKSMLTLRNENEKLPEADFYSPETILIALAPEKAQIDSLEIHVLARLMKISDNVKRFLSRDSFSQDKALGKLAAGLADFKDILLQLSELFDENGDIKDNASPLLETLRPQVHLLEKKINNKLSKILRSDNDDLFQDAIITRRNNRFVIPVKREAKNKIKGIVHDESASGRTLFVEPQSLISDGNELVSTIRSIDSEIRRILAEVSEFMRQRITDIRQSFRALCAYDAAYAVSAWASDFSCSFAEQGNNFELIKARHPILQEQFRREKKEDMLTPLDLELRQAKVLAITGSNTGGKTVSLKTIGLFSLMFQAGLPIPAEQGSRLPFFDNILADIGDEQSLQQSLSTFSGHLKNIAHILKETQNSKSLVLLDELGSGTDPVEGGALGCAIIKTLAERDTITFATTHLGMIKVFVHENKSMINASVRFNRETLEPEYILDVGLPGASHAISIASRLDIPATVIDTAKSFLSEEELKLESVLERLDSSQRSLAKDAENARLANEKASQERQQIHQELLSLKLKRKEMLHDAQNQAEAIVENSRKEMEQIIKQLKSQGQIPDDIKQVRAKVEKKRDNLRHGLQQTTPKPAEPLTTEAMTIGARVWVERLQDYGTILSLSNDLKKAKIDLNGFPVGVKVADLGTATQLKPSKKESQTKVKSHFRKPTVSMELNIIGKRVEPALKELESYLDNAITAGLDQVRVIHGRGTGVLRKAIHEYLKRCSFVSHFACPEAGEDSPGDTVTDVFL